MRGPQRPLYAKKAKKPVLRPVSVYAAHSGVTGDIRPSVANNNLQRLQWGIVNRQTQGDWEEAV